MTVSPVQAVLDVFRDECVDRVFGNPGTTELPLLAALAEAPDIAYVLGVQEASVVAMADGYARATGRPAVVSLHAAGGTANGLVGLLNARRSRTPLVALAGQQDRRHLAQDPMLSADIAALARPAVKESLDVHHAFDLPLMLRRAFDLARRAPAGPVLLTVPMDLLAEDTAVEVPVRSGSAPAQPSGGLARAAELLARAENPVIVAGDGVGRSGAVRELVTVAEAAGARVFHQPMFDRLDFPLTHPLHQGMLGASHADIRKALEGHDLILIVGCHAFTPHHYTPVDPIPPGATVVQLDDDPAEPGRNFPVALGLTGGVKESLSALRGELRAHEDLPARARKRMVAARERAHSHMMSQRARAATLKGPAPFDPAAAVLAVASALPREATVVEEAITAGLLLRQALRLDRPGSYVHTVGGGLGHGIGAAIGTRLGDPARPVVAVLGDGCTLFGLQGLWSAARYQVPVTFVVMNNGEYRTLKQTLDAWDSPAAQPLLDLAPPPLDFTRAAEFFAIPAVRPDTLEELSEAIAGSAHATTPVLVEVRVTGHSGARGTREDG
ncbi:thiamine pyrophosphate-binding protein [Streptomyces sp. NPDC021969]|uniref:thiamine pyrophosphate-binding protein n=1 Tax=unclassified Streptomyces TaxID=2593676 RepID=UPI0033F69ABF